MYSHTEKKAAERDPGLKGDESRWPLYEKCPEPWDRLNIFQWERMCDHDPDATVRDSVHAQLTHQEEIRKWVCYWDKPISQLSGVNTSGLLEACEAAAAIVQGELHESSSPLDMWAAVELWHFRLGYLKALKYLGGNRLAKDIEANAAPNGQALTICIGSNKAERVMTVRGPRKMYGYPGCWCVFPDLPFGPGNRWPRQCPKCEPQRSNAKNKAITELRRRAARSLSMMVQ